jgi:uncharacterized membrane protein
LRHDLWNLFLAIVPVILGVGLGWGLRGKGKQRNLPLWVCLPLAAAWLAFLPNTCYLLTEWRHLLFDARWEPLLDAGSHDRAAMFSVAKWSLFFLAYTGVGVLCLALAVRPVEHALRAARQKFYLYAPMLFFLTSLGVYLGLIVRLNSWDLWNRPLFVWRTAIDALLNPTLLTAVCVFGVVLWAMYEAVDLWVDGIADRVKRLAGAGAAAPRSAREGA